MRKELQQLDYYVYGLSENDIDYILELVQRVRDAHIGRTQDRIAPFRDDPEAIEAIDDEAYYTYLDTVFLWEYALWRLQGVFEGLITTVFLPQGPRKHLPGLRAKLEAMRKAGYSVSDARFTALLEWATLRNALSHSPPEQYRPMWIEEQDLLEYASLLREVCRHWRNEKVDLEPELPAPEA
jgi:hypothetical protein